MGRQLLYTQRNGSSNLSASTKFDVPQWVQEAEAATFSAWNTSVRIRPAVPLSPPSAIGRQLRFQRGKASSSLAGGTIIGGADRLMKGKSEAHRERMAAGLRRSWIDGKCAARWPRRVVDWAAAQKAYDSGLSIRQVAALLGVSRAAISRGAKAGMMTVRSSSAAMKVWSRYADRHTMWTDERRAERSRQRKEFLKEHPEKHPNSLLANNRRSMSYPERTVYDWLVSRGVVFVHNARVGMYWVDFMIGNMTALEVDGAYWHDAERDRKRDAELLRLGVSVVRVEASLILKRGPGVIADLIRDVA